MTDFNRSCTFDAFHPDNRRYALSIVMDDWIQTLVDTDPEQRLQVRIEPIPYMARTLRQKKPNVIHIHAVLKRFIETDCRLWC